MKTIEIKAGNKDFKYSVLIGSRILNVLKKKINLLCPKARKVGIIVDKNVPKKYIKLLKQNLRNYKIYIVNLEPSEKNKSFTTVNALVEKFLKDKFNRSDVIIGMGGGIIGDVSAFVASILKRGVNFFNIPTTLLSQVDSSIGGKTGVNSSSGKNLIGSFYQPKLVLSDVTFLDSLSKREIICGYAEILKHAVIKDYNFFNWLKINTKLILRKNRKALVFAIQKSCKIKLYFVNKDEKEKGLRMNLNYGHTFAHAIEVKNNYSKRINHGEAVLIGMLLAAKVSLIKKICSKKTLDELKFIYNNNNLNYDLKRFFEPKESIKLISYMQNDKKNNDNKINFIFLKKIGQTTTPGKFKLSIASFKKVFKKII